MTRLVFFKYGPGPTMMATDVFDCDSMTDEEISTQAYLLAVDRAERYGDFVLEGEECLDDPEGSDHYFTESDISYRWEDYVPEKHDMYRCGGGSWMNSKIKFMGDLYGTDL